MRMIEIDYEAQPPIDSYGPGGFRIAGDWHAGSVLVLPSGIEPVEEALEFRLAALASAHSGEIDILLIGMGADIAPLASVARAALEEAGIGFEIMSTSSACRTYNVLLTEDRRVGAALVAL